MVSSSVLPIDEKHAVTTNLEIANVCALVDEMISQEKATYRCTDYMATNKRGLRFVRNPVDQELRSAMCQWCYSVIHIHNFQRETVVEAFSYLDRYLNTSQGRTALAHRDIYQLAVMTALYIAIKINEECDLGIEELLELSSGTYSQSNVEKMESRMLDALEWKMNVPTPCSFIRSFSALIPEVTDSTIVSYAQHEVQLAVAKYNFVNYKPSEIAVAALVKGILKTDNEILPLRIKEEHIGSVKRACGLFVDVDLDGNECLHFLLSEVSDPTQQLNGGHNNDSQGSANAYPPSRTLQDEDSLSAFSAYCYDCSSSGNSCEFFEGVSLSLINDVSPQNGPMSNQNQERASSTTVTNVIVKNSVIETENEVDAHNKTTIDFELEAKATLLPGEGSRHCINALSA